VCRGGGVGAWARGRALPGGGGGGGGAPRVSGVSRRDPPDLPGLPDLRDHCGAPFVRSARRTKKSGRVSSAEARHLANSSRGPKARVLETPVRKRRVGFNRARRSARAWPQRRRYSAIGTPHRARYRRPDQAGKRAGRHGDVARRRIKAHVFALAGENWCRVLERARVPAASAVNLSAHTAGSPPQARPRRWCRSGDTPAP